MVDSVHTSCILCSLGCRFVIESRANEATALEYDPGDGNFGGKLCGKGNFALELINHPFRLVEPKIPGETVSWPDALDRMAREFSSAKSAGVILGGEASDEEAALARNFAETCLPDGRAGAYFPAGDDRVYRALAAAGAGRKSVAIGDIAESACVVAVGDPFEIAPVIARPVLKAKHARRGNTFAVVANGSARTARFATVHFNGPERWTLAGMLRYIADAAGGGAPEWLRAAAKCMPEPGDAATANLATAILKTPSSVMILETQDPVTASLAALVAGAAAGGRLMTVFSHANTAGIARATGDGDILAAVRGGAVDALLVLGADPAGSGDDDLKRALESVRFLAAGAAFENGTTRSADLVLPAALWLETEGTWNGAGLRPVVEPPGAALSCGEILKRLAGKMGAALSPEPAAPLSEQREPTAGLVEMLASQLGEEPPAPRVRSSTVRHCDGALTDFMEWNLHAEVGRR